MSQETLQAVHDAIQAHVRDRNENQNIVVDDWVVGYCGMMHNPDAPTGLGHLSGYMVSADSTPQSSVGTMTLALRELDENLSMGCCCHEHEGGD